MKSYRIPNIRPANTVAPRCGHVTCLKCTDLQRESRVCFVCETPFKKNKKDMKVGDKDGFIELQIEGSGYAAGLKGPAVTLKRQTFGN